MTGTLVNAAAVIAGSLMGVAVRSRMPGRLVDIVFQCIGLFTAVLGISMALEAENMLLVIISLVAGAVIGQALRISRGMENLSESLLRRFSKNGSGGVPGQDAEADAGAVKAEDEVPGPEDTAPEKSRFTEGLITATMLFCVGSMSIIGAMEEGLGGSPDLLITKAIMDGICSMVLASTFGISVIFSAVPLLIYQGGLTLLAGRLSDYATPNIIADLTAVGGILLLGLAVNILKVRNVNIDVINMLPSLVAIVFLSWFFG